MIVEDTIVIDEFEFGKSVRKYSKYFKDDKNKLWREIDSLEKIDMMCNEVRFKIDNAYSMHSKNTKLYVNDMENIGYSIYRYGTSIQKGIDKDCKIKISTKDAIKHIKQFEKYSEGFDDIWMKMSCQD